MLLTTPRRRPRRAATPWCGRLVPAAMLALACPWAVSQEASGSTGPRPPLELSPSASAALTALSSSGDAIPGQLSINRDVVSQFTAGLRASARSRMLQGDLSYTAQMFRYGELTQANRVAQAVRGSGRLSLVEDHAFVDLGISRAETGQSAFGAPVQVNTLASLNRVEVTNASVSPTLEGRLLQTVEVSARYTHAVSNSNRSAIATAGVPTPAPVGTLETNTLNLSLSGGARLGWRLDIQDSTRQAPTGRRIDTSSVSGTIRYEADVDVKLRLGVGVEENNVLSGAFQNTTTGLVGVQWTPTPRTAVDAEISERYFGRGHQFSLRHQMARTVIRVSDTRQVTALLGGGGALPGVGPVSLLEELLRGNAAGGSGSVAQREQTILEGLRAAGIDPAQTVQPGSLNTTPSLNRRQELFLGYSGLRLSWSASGFTSELQRLGNPLNPFEDLALVPVVRQAGFAASAGWRLSPQSNLVASLAQSRTPRTGPLPGRELQSASLAFSTKVGQGSTLTLSLQQVEQSTNTAAARLQRRNQTVGAVFSLRF